MVPSTQKSSKVRQQGTNRTRQRNPGTQEQVPSTQRTPQALSHTTIQRAMEAPDKLTTEDVLALQRTIGNAAVQRILAGSHRTQSSTDTTTGTTLTDRSPTAPSFTGPSVTGPSTGSFTSNLPVQFKLEVGAVDDKYEREANRVARQVLSRLDAPAPHSSTPTVQRAPEETAPSGPTLGGGNPDQDPLVHGGSASAGVERSIRSGSSGGRPLPDQVRRRMESAFNADLSQVRIHTDAKANTLNRSLSAKAFTHGTDIYFSKHAFDPNSRAGQGLLAHELAHVVQQGGAHQGSVQQNGTVQGGVQREPDEARRSDIASRLPSADRVARSESTLGQTPRIVQRSNAGRVHRCGFSNPFSGFSNPFKKKKELTKQERAIQEYQRGRITTMDLGLGRYP